MLQEHYNLNISQLSAGVIENEEVTLTRNCAVLSNVFLTIIAIVFFNVNKFHVHQCQAQIEI